VKLRAVKKEKSEGKNPYIRNRMLEINTIYEFHTTRDVCFIYYEANKNNRKN